MGKFSQAMVDIYSVFDQPEWKALNIQTAPRGVVLPSVQNEFVRVSVIPSEKGLNKVSLSGIIIVDIFITAGQGQKRQFLIADELEKFLAGKSIATGSDTRTQFFEGSVSALKPDADAKSLMRASYTIPFKHFGVN